MKTGNKFESLKFVFAPITEKSYMVSLKNSKEFLAVLRRYGRLFSRILYKRSQVSNRLQLLTKFGNHVLRLNRDHGPEFVVKYLKACTVSLQRFIGGVPLKTMREIEPDLPLPGLCRGLPKFIPSRDRRELDKLTVSVVRWYLTIFSLYRIISCPPKLKLSTILDPFTGNSESLALICTWLEAKTSQFVSRRVKVPKLQASLGLERIQKASPSARVSWKGFLMDVKKWYGRPQLYNYACWSGSFSLYYDWFMTWKGLIQSRYFQDMHSGEDIIPRPSLTRSVVNGIKIINEQGSLMVEKSWESLGQLALKKEAAGKVRVFAMVDVWTQSILKPLHDALFRMFKSFPNDSTHDQNSGFHRAQEKAQYYGQAYCYDLSAATDRLPIQLQIAVLNSLWGGSPPSEDNVTASSFGQAWADLLVDRDYILPSSEITSSLEGLVPQDRVTKEGIKIRYAVGQPMGALSSWAMLNLTHHMILQMINYYIYRNIKWYENYEVLGDDIVIFDKQVAFYYLDVMENHLGVKCNQSKSLIAPQRPVIEFAKRVSIGAFEVSGFSWRQFRSEDSLFGRASTAWDLLMRKVKLHPLRAFKVLTGNKKWSNIDSYLYSLLFAASNIVKSGQLPLAILCDLLIDPKNPFRFIGGRIVGNLRAGVFEDLLLRYVKGLPIQMPRVWVHKIWSHSRLFEAFARGYLTDRIAELVIEMSRNGINYYVDQCSKTFGPPLPHDVVLSLFYWGRYREVPSVKTVGRFEHLPISELLTLYDRLTQVKRDLEFYKFNVDRKPRLDNPLKLISFLERSKKAGIISIEIKR